MKKKVISIVTFLLLISLNINMLLPTVFSAQSEKYTYTDKYKTSKFYNDLQAFAKTGDHRFDVISIALSQVGYHEGNSNDDFDGRNLNGTGNYAECNVSYGYYDVNVGYAYDWCASFVSWCLRQAQVPKTIAPSEISCHRMIKEKYQPMGKYQLSASKGGGYIPKVGDVIFFEPTPGTGFISNHVGLVRGVKDGRVYTVEGNSGNKVALHNYSLTDTKIVGYGTPDYTELSTVDYSVFELTDYKLGYYVVDSNGGLNLRSGIGTSYDVVKIMTNRTIVKVDEVSSGWGKITYDGGSGWASMSYMILKDDYDYYIDWQYITYNANGGITPPKTLEFIYGDTVKISLDKPTRKGYEFQGWGLTANSTTVVYNGGETLTSNDGVNLYAIWKPIQYTITFLNYDDTVLSTKTYIIDEKVEIPQTPTRLSDETYNYVFKDWDNPVSTYVKESKTYKAVFNAVSIIEETTIPPITETTKNAIETTTASPIIDTTTSPVVQDTTIDIIDDTSDIPAGLETFDDINDDDKKNARCLSSSMFLNIFAAVTIVGSSLIFIVKKH